MVHVYILVSFSAVLVQVRGEFPFENSIKWVAAPRNQILLLDQEPVGIEVDNTLFLCRIHYEGNTVPGKIWIRNGTISCHVPYRGVEYGNHDFEMLVTYPGVVSWKKFDGQIQIKENMIPTGKMDGDASYVCRARLENDILPGRLSSTDLLCHVGRGGIEYTRNVSVEYLGINYLGITIKTPIRSEVTIGDSADRSQSVQENDMVNLFTTVADFLYKRVSFFLFL